MFDNPEVLFGGTAQLLDLIDSIYSTVQSPERWPAVLASIASALGGESLAMFTMFPGSRVADILALHEMSPESWDRFATYYAALNPILPRVERALNLDQTVYQQDVISDRELEHTEFYADFFRRENMHHCVGTRIQQKGALAANLSCQRPKSAGTFDERADVVYRTVKPHLERALALYRHTDQIEAKSAHFESVLNAFGHAVLGVDDAGKIVFANQHGEDILRAGSGLCSVEGVLHAVDRACDRELSALLLSCAPAAVARPVASAPLTVPRAAAKRPLLITVTPARSTLAGMPPSVTALILVVDPSRRPQARDQLLQSVYRLTPTEVRIAGGLLDGLETRVISQRLHITQESCRFYIKRIFRKTNTARQTELQRLLLSLPGHA